MIDLSTTIIAKSDQLNADDLIDKTITIKVARVSKKDGDEQPISIHYEGDNGKPYKPGKSMRRVMAHLWGRDASVYPGRSMTLYRDDKVRFGGLTVGGIRISHMSDIARETTIALTETRGNKKPFTVKPLKVEQPAPQQQAEPAIAEAEVERLKQMGDEAATRGTELLGVFWGARSKAEKLAVGGALQLATWKARAAEIDEAAASDPDLQGAE